MGNLVGVHTDDEVGGMDKDDRERLKQRILHQLQTSPEIRAIINEDPRILTRDSKINEILRREVRSVYEQLKKK